MTPAVVLFVLSAIAAIVLSLGAYLTARREQRDQRAAERFRREQFTRDRHDDINRPHDLASLKQPAAKGFRR